MTHTLSPQLIANVRKDDPVRVRAALDASVRAGREMASNEVRLVEAYLRGSVSPTFLLELLEVEQTFESKIVPQTVDSGGDM